jgi:integrase
VRRGPRGPPARALRRKVFEPGAWSETDRPALLRLYTLYIIHCDVDFDKEACPDLLRPIVALAIFTGMRRGEIIGLRWLDLDLADQRICCRRP